MTWKMPETEQDIFLLLSQIKSIASKCCIEKIGAMPKSMCGNVSMFKLGRSLGGLRMAVIGNGIPLEEVRPQDWQKVLGCMTKGDKNISKAKAQMLFPDMTIIHDTADSLLIAEYGRRVSV